MIKVRVAVREEIEYELDMTIPKTIVDDEIALMDAVLEKAQYEGRSLSELSRTIAVREQTATVIEEKEEEDEPLEG